MTALKKVFHSEYKSLSGIPLIIFLVTISLTLGTVSVFLVFPTMEEYFTPVGKCYAVRDGIVSRDGVLKFSGFARAYMGDGTYYVVSGPEDASINALVKLCDKYVKDLKGVK